MRGTRRILSMILALVMLLGCAYAQSLDARWTLGNIRITADEEEFIIGPEAEFEILQSGENLALDFGVDMAGRRLLPLTAQINPNAINFSLGSRVYSLNISDLIDSLELTEEEKSMLGHLGDTIQSASAFIGKSTSEYMRQNDEIINRMYEILVGKNAQPIEITVGEVQLQARRYAGNLKVVHFADLLEYIRKSENEEIALFGDSLLKLMNAVTGEEYEYFFDYFYDGYFNDFFGAEDGESLGEMEIILGYNDDLVYEKTTQSGEDMATVVSEAVYTQGGTVVKTTETYADDESNFATHTVMEIDGPITAPTAIRMTLDSDEGYIQKNEPANLTLTVRDVIGLSFDASVQDGLWTASLTGSQDTAAAYDYGSGPVVINDEFDLTGSYAEERAEDGRINGKADLGVTLDGHSATLQFEIGRGAGARIEPLVGENTQTFTLDVQEDSMANKLLSADFMAMAASAAELYADPGVYGLMDFVTEDGPDWPDDLGDDVYNKYNRAYYEQWWTVYRYADAARIFTGNVPRYSEPANSVLSGIHVGAHNMLIDYLSNDGDFQIDITYLGDGKPLATNPAPIPVSAFTFVEEEDMLMAYYCDGEYLIFFDFENPDRERAKDVISGLRLATKKVGLSA